MNYMKELTDMTCELPYPVLDDINRRVGDWLASGGKETDEYIKQQVNYAKRVINCLNK